jgi:hypothetical protein
MEQLLEDYKRRLATANKMLKDMKESHVINVLKYSRVQTKASCYRKFISELEALIAKQKDKTNY